MRTVVEDFLRKGIVSLNVGMSDEGTVRVSKWGLNGREDLGKFLLQFTRVTTEKWYRIEQLKNFWVVPWEGLRDGQLTESIRDVAGVGFTYWGADVVLLDEECHPIAAINYPTTLQSLLATQFTDGYTKDWWHTTFGGAAQAAYQAMPQAYFLRRRLTGEAWKRVEYIVPVTDYLFYVLTGCKGHDTTMLQSQGLYSSVARRVVEQRVGLPSGMVCPWEDFGTDAVFGSPTNTLFVPGSHDSVFARLVGFSVADVVAWTGSWLGVAAKADIAPCEATLELGLSFEGLAPRAVQKNTGMFGPVNDELRTRAGLKYAEVKDCVLGWDVTPPAIDAAKINAMTPQQGADYVCKCLADAGLESTPARGLATLIHGAAKTVARDLHAVWSAVSTQPLLRVAVVGGWVENEAFRALLAKYGAFDVVAPPHAKEATDVGYVADMLRRMAKFRGEEIDLTEALQALPG